MSTKQVYKTKVPSLKNYVCWVKDFSFVKVTSYKLRASTVVNHQNKIKEWIIKSAFFDGLWVPCSNSTKWIRELHFEFRISCL